MKDTGSRKKSEENEVRGSENENETFFDKLSNDKGHLKLQKILDKLEKSGISKNNPQLKKNLGSHLQKPGDYQQKLTKGQFLELLNDPNSEVLKKVLKNELVIPDFQDFKKDIEGIYQESKNKTGGEINDSIPHPEKERQPAYAVSICTVDGQLLQLGDHDLAFVLQSLCKPVNYAIAHKESGKEKVHEHVGFEPGSESFRSSMVLNEKDLPHNPMLTSGAMMTSALIKPDLEVKERLEHVMNVWGKMTGNKEVSYNEDSFKMEQDSPNKHFALAHLMKERGAFPDGVDLDTLINFYFKCCAIEVNIDDLAHAAATLANYGKCPSTGKKIFQHDTVRDTLSLMYSSGMYDHSGEFAFRVGMPAKSGIAGGIMVIIPNLMGIAVYSPPLDVHGNSVRGVAFCENLVDKFNFHKFDTISSSLHGKKDPRKQIK